MPAPRLPILANHSAGALRARGQVPLAHWAREAGFEPELVYARGPRHFRATLREWMARRPERIAVAGGDGTVHLAVQQLAGSETTLGIVPQGTANNFAGALRLPLEPAAAFRLIAEGERRAVDLGRAGEEYFTEAAGVGVLADLLAITGGQHRWRSVLRGIGVLARIVIQDRARRLTLVIDGVPHAEEVFSVTVANSFSVGYNIPIAPDARVTDAQLDVVVIDALERREMLTYYRAVQGRVHAQLPKVHVQRARTVEIRARHRTVVHVDERASLRTPVSIAIAPRALWVMAGRL